MRIFLPDRDKIPTVSPFDFGALPMVQTRRTGYSAIEKKERGKGPGNDEKRNPEKNHPG